MIQRFLIAAIVGFLVLTSQIASAADIDWNSAPRICSKAEFARYIEEGRRNGQTVFPMIITNKLFVNTQAELNALNQKLFLDRLAGAPYAISDMYGNGTGRITYKITEYPGTRVANAYLSRNQYESWLELTNEEKQLYNIAVSIVDEANKHLSVAEKVRYIHKAICNRIKEYKSHTNEDAIGALVIGVTNCQGISDSFYALCRMCNFDVIRVHGLLNGEPHAWNAIDFGDGKFYFVDVLYDYQHSSLDCFKATRTDMIRLNYDCEWEIIPNLQ